MHECKALADDVVSYFRNHRPWKNVGNDEEVLENESDQKLFEQAYSVLNKFSKDIKGSIESLESYPGLVEEIDDYLDAEEYGDEMLELA